MRPEDAEEYTQSLGQIVSGSWRQILLAKKMGVPKALGMQVDEWVNERLGGYVRMAISERREAVLQLTKEGHSNREIAEAIGVTEGTVRSDKGAQNYAPGENDHNGMSRLHQDSAQNYAPDDNPTKAELAQREAELARQAEFIEQNRLAQLDRVKREQGRSAALRVAQWPGDVVTVSTAIELGEKQLLTAEVVTQAQKAAAFLTQLLDEQNR